MEKTGSGTAKMLSGKEQQAALQLARETMLAFLENRAPNLPRQIPAGLLSKKGVFVALSKKGEWSSPVGSLENWQTAWEGIQESALSAAFNHPDFLPLDKQELLEAKIEISLATMPQSVEYSSAQELLQKIVPGECGMMLEKNEHRAIFLPASWKEFPEKEIFLSNLCKKAGLDADEWKSAPAKIAAFTAFCFAEK